MNNRNLVAGAGLISFILYLTMIILTAFNLDNWRFNLSTAILFFVIGFYCLHILYKIDALKQDKVKE